MSLRASIVVLLWTALAVGCGPGGAPQKAALSPQLALPGAAQAARSADRPAAASPVEDVVARSNMLIRTATIDIEVESYAAASKRVEAIALEAGGYVSGANVSRDEHGGASGKLSIRIPAERFDAVLDALSTVGTVRHERLSTEDVGKAYADLETRIAVKRETADRLRKILESRTGKLGDVLEVERELSRVVGEIEQMEGERRYYDRRIALSTVEIDLHEPGARSNPGLFDPLRKSFASAVRMLVESLAYFVTFTAVLLPWLLVAGLILWLFLRRRSRRTA